ncbi:hypothetical protein GGR57DRAFT_515658, partial [Xylariaceae sp. FL1272]
LRTQPHSSILPAPIQYLSDNQQLSDPTTRQTPFKMDQKISSTELTMNGQNPGQFNWAPYAVHLGLWLLRSLFEQHCFHNALTQESLDNVPSMSFLRVILFYLFHLRTFIYVGFRLVFSEFEDCVLTFTGQHLANQGFEYSSLCSRIIHYLLLGATAFAIQAGRTKGPGMWPFNLTKQVTQNDVSSWLALATTFYFRFHGIKEGIIEREQRALASD